jgi:hypothetical protein
MTLVPRCPTRSSNPDLGQLAGKNAGVQIRTDLCVSDARRPRWSCLCGSSEIPLDRDELSEGIPTRATPEPLERRPKQVRRKSADGVYTITQLLPPQGGDRWPSEKCKRAKRPIGASSTALLKLQTKRRKSAPYLHPRRSAIEHSGSPVDAIGHRSARSQGLLHVAGRSRLWGLGLNRSRFQTEILPRFLSLFTAPRTILRPRGVRTMDQPEETTSGAPQSNRASEHSQDHLIPWSLGRGVPLGSGMQEPEKYQVTVGLVTAVSTSSNASFDKFVNEFTKRITNKTEEIFGQNQAKENTAIPKST